VEKVKRSFIVVLSLVLVGVLFGQTFLLSPKSLNNAYWFAVENGMKDAAKVLGVKAIFDAPIEADAAQQAQKINSYISSGVNGIAISPNDPAGIKIVVKNALSKGIPVITFDSDAPESGRYVYLGTNNYNAGYEAGKLMAEKILSEKPGQSTINLAILTGGLAALNTNERIAGFKDAFADFEKETGIKVRYVADPFPSEDDVAKAVQIVRDVERTYPNLDGWFTANANILLAPNQTVISAFGGEQKMKDKLIVGFDTLPQELELVDAGLVDGLVGQRPYDMGYLSLTVLYMMDKVGVENVLKILPKEQYEDGSYDYIIDTGVDVITSENVKEFIEFANRIYTR